MAVAVVQSLSPSSANATSSLQSAAFGSAVTAGNTVLVAVGFFDAGHTGAPTVTDTAGNTYTLDVNVPQAGNADRKLCLYRSSNVTGGASFKVTATGASGDYFAIAAMEVSGLTSPSTADGSGSSNSNAGSTSPTTGSWSTTNANDLLIAVVTTINVAGTSFSATPSGFSSWGSLGGGSGISIDCRYQIVAATQSGINQSWTLSGSDNWNALGYAYQATGGGGGGSAVGADALNYYREHIMRGAA